VIFAFYLKKYKDMLLPSKNVKTASFLQTFHLLPSVFLFPAIYATGAGRGGQGGLLPHSEKIRVWALPTWKYLL